MFLQPVHGTDICDVFDPCLMQAVPVACVMELILPTPLSEKLSCEDAALHLAIGLFVTEEATLGQASQVAGLSQAAFLRELGRRRIPIHYGPEELLADLQAVGSLVTQAG